MMTERQTREFKFTIIAGEFKGRKITAPDLGVTRPPLSRLRKSIFDFLQPYLAGAAYLDLFSGTGSYLFEVVSRGVATAVAQYPPCHATVRASVQSVTDGAYSSRPLP